MVNLALADRQKLTVAELLGLVGPYLQLDFMYEEKDVAQEVTLNPHGKFSGPIKINDLYFLLEEVLKFKGLAMTRGKGNLVTIVPVGNALDIDPTFLEADKGRIERGDGIVQQIFILKHIDISSAQNLLTGMKLTTSITPIPETKTLIVTGYAHRMPRIQTLLNIVDKAGEPKKFRFRPLRYTMAQTLAPKLQTLAEQLGTISITVAETAATAAPTTPSKQRPGETTAQYQARLRAESAARARQLASMRAAGRTTTPQPPEPHAPTVHLDADERTNRILMIGLAEQLDDVEELIDTLDVAQQDLRTLELYKIEHIDAEEARKKLEELDVISPTSMIDSPRITDGTKPAATTTTARSPTRTTATARRLQTGEETESLLEEPQVVVIEPTNSLLANATAEQHAQISRILAYVDSETDKEDIPYKLYPLENQSPGHLSEVLEKLIQETVQDKEGKIQQVIPKQDEQITIVPDPNTFSLIVYASKKNQEWISSLIEQLDQRRPQVLIDVTLVEISKSDAFNYDLNIISSFPDLASTSGLTGAIMPGGEGTNLVSRLMNSDRDHFVDLQADGGRGTGFYGDRHINALLTLMQEKDYGRVLAKPKILVNDNELGTISTTDRTYVTKTSSIPVTAGGAGQDATLIQTAVDYQDYPAGITLGITPHISRGDFLRLEIQLERSDFGTITGEKPPDTTESNIETTVTVPDASTIILGGLLKLNQSKGGTKVPLLGDIPFIGGLFRSTSNSDIQRNLYVFVKAEIIRPEGMGLAQGGLQQISQRNRSAFEEYETEFQEYHDWPGIEPKPMTPPKVLDAQ
ncbi:MAG: secretin N-terminal domain-containing protein [Planctomycetota bacterium]